MEIVNLLGLLLVCVFKLGLLVLESLLHAEDFFLLGHQGPADFANLVLQFLLQLDNALFTPLEVQCMVAKLCFE